MAENSGIKLEYNSVISPEEQIFICTAPESKINKFMDLVKHKNISLESFGLNTVMSIPKFANNNFLQNSPSGPGYTGLNKSAINSRDDNKSSDINNLAFPNDPYYKYQWHLKAIGIDAVWNKFSGKGITVAVIDTGVAYTDHGKFKQVEDLKNVKFVKGYDFVDNDAFPIDENGHGTHVAGTIAQATNNSKGVAGAAFSASIMPVRVLNGQGSGTMADVAEGIRWAAKNGAHIINLSLGGPSGAKFLEDACKYAKAKGCIIVCAAGNSNTDRKFYPAGYSSAMAVASVESRLKRAFYSNYGDWISISGPGGDTRADYNGDGQPDGVLQCTIDPAAPERSVYAQFMGTSMAAPHVSAAAAVLLSSGRVPARLVQRKLEESAEKLNESQMGAGCVNIENAIEDTGYSRDLRRFFISIFIIIGIFANRGLNNIKRLFLRPSFIISFVLTISGLGIVRFLNFPFTGISDLFFMSLIEWFEALIDSDIAYSPIVYSFVLPVFYTLAVVGWPAGKRSALAFTAGYSTLLFDTLLFGHGDVALIPGISFLDSAWLLINFIIVFLFARMIAVPENDDVFFNDI
jgi:serine protease